MCVVWFLGKVIKALFGIVAGWVAKIVVGIICYGRSERKMVVCIVRFVIMVTVGFILY